jgi:hypothetical protein
MIIVRDVTVPLICSHGFLLVLKLMKDTLSAVLAAYSFVSRDDIFEKKDQLVEPRLSAVILFSIYLGMFSIWVMISSRFAGVQSSDGQRCLG